MISPVSSLIRACQRPGQARHRTLAAGPDTPHVCFCNYLQAISNFEG